MKRLRHWLGSMHGLRPAALQLAGGMLVTSGLYQMYRPAAFVFAGAAFVFVAQGIERDD